MKTPIKKLVLTKETVKALAVASGVRTGMAAQSVVANSLSTGGYSVAISVPPKLTDSVCGIIIIGGGEE